MRGDSLVLQVLITDVRRGMVVNMVESPTTTVEEPMRSMAELARRTAIAIERAPLDAPLGPPTPPSVRPPLN